MACEEEHWPLEVLSDSPSRWSVWGPLDLSPWIVWALFVFVLVMTLVDFLTGFHAVPLWLNRPFGFATAPNSCDHCQSLYFPGKFHSSTCSAVMVTLKISTRLSRSFILALRNCLTFTHSHLHTYVHTCIREYLEYSCELSECKRERADLSSQRPCGCSALLSPFLSFSAGGNQIYFQFASKTHPHTHTRGRSLVCLFVCRVCYSWLARFHSVKYSTPRAKVLLTYWCCWGHTGNIFK